MPCWDNVIATRRAVDAAAGLVLAGHVAKVESTGIAHVTAPLFDSVLCCRGHCFKAASRAWLARLKHVQVCAQEIEPRNTAIAHFFFLAALAQHRPQIVVE
jgi:hypothetical protein